MPPLLTPLDVGGQVDEAAFGRLIEHVLDGGPSGLFVLGTTGEATSLPTHEKHAVVRYACQHSAGRIPVLAGLIETSEYAIESLAGYAADRGVSGLVLTPPFYLQIQQDELLAFIERVAPRLPLPVFLYNIPGLTKIPMEPSTVLAASGLPNVVGLKDSSGDLEYLAAIRRTVRRDFLLFCGPEEKLAAAVALGADGGVSGGANLFPSFFVHLFAAAARHDTVAVAEMQSVVEEISSEIHNVGASYPAGLKQAMEEAGVPCGPPAAPVRAVNAGERSRIQACVRRLMPLVDKLVAKSKER